MAEVPMQADPLFIVADESKLGWLRERRASWQFGETGLIDALLEKIDPKDDFTFAEVGAGNGSPSLPLTCQRLINRGWSGDLYEMEPESVKQLRLNFAENPKINIIEGKVATLQSAPHRRIYVIDVDSIDWYLLMTLLMNEEAHPDLIICEHLDLCCPKGKEMVIANPKKCGTDMGAPGHFRLQASSSVLEFLMQPTYLLVCVTRVNSFFVRADLIDKFLI
jgi:hypothetical protein